MIGSSSHNYHTKSHPQRWFRTDGHVNDRLVYYNPYENAVGVEESGEYLVQIVDPVVERAVMRQIEQGEIQITEEMPEPSSRRRPRGSHGWSGKGSSRPGRARRNRNRNRG